MESGKLNGGYLRENTKKYQLSYKVVGSAPYLSHLKLLRIYYTCKE